LEYRPYEGEPLTVAVLDNYIHSEENGWNHTIDQLGLFFEHALALPPNDSRMRELAAFDAPVLDERQLESGLLAELIGHYLENVRLLGLRTAELHLALSSRADIPEFAPEPFTDFYRLSLYHGLIGHVTRSFEQLRLHLSDLPEGTQEEARNLLNRETEVRRQFQEVRDQRIYATCIRHHGNYHLGEVLYTGRDFVIIDFEGDPSRPLSERRLKRSPLRDVASMVRSFHYAAHAALYGQVPGIVPGTSVQVEKWAHAWYRCVSAAFVKAYLKGAGNADFVPQSQTQLQALLRAFVLEKAIMEMAHEVGHRPDWARIPIHAILDFLERWPTRRTVPEQNES
jgi:maltose alpha-D-glucosyltransferase/alpha-amylase